MTPQLVIGDKVINENSDCFVIAEVGHNHQGNIDTCKKMFDAAKESGADAVKLQKRNNRQLYTKEFYDSPYNSENAYAPTYGTHRDALEFGEPEYHELKAYAESLGLIFFSTPFDFESADFLEDLGSPCYKIASGDLTNTPLIKHVASFGKPTIISTGASSMEDVVRAYETAKSVNPNIALLQCTAAYPCDFEMLDLNVIKSYRERFPDVIVGLSSHDNGIAMAVAAYVLGARVIEKHFTLNRTMKGTDHAFSLEPIGLRKMVRDLQRTRVALGDGTKKFYDLERKPREKMGKKIVAARELPVGHVLESTDLAYKSPGDGLNPYHADHFIGKKLKQALTAEQSLEFEHVH